MRLNFLEPDIYVGEYGEWVGDKLVMRQVPMFTCGHCTSPVAVRLDRTRPRTRCQGSCGKLLCEKNELCMTGECIPMHAMARDHFEADFKWTKYVDLIMKGATTLEEARAGGLNG